MDELTPRLPGVLPASWGRQSEVGAVPSDAHHVSLVLFPLDTPGPDRRLRGVGVGRGAIGVEGVESPDPSGVWSGGPVGVLSTWSITGSPHKRSSLSLSTGIYHSEGKQNCLETPIVCH